MTLRPLFALVTVILAVGVATLIVPTDLHGDVARPERARSDVREIADVVMEFVRKHRRLPSLTELTARDGDEPPLVEDLPLDPWGHEYALVEGTTLRSFAIVSAGPDGALGSDDDIRSRTAR